MSTPAPSLFPTPVNLIKAVHFSFITFLPMHSPPPSPSNFNTPSSFLLLDFRPRSRKPAIKSVLYFSLRCHSIPPPLSVVIIIIVIVIVIIIMNQCNVIIPDDVIQPRSTTVYLSQLNRPYFSPRRNYRPPFELASAN